MSFGISPIVMATIQSAIISAVSNVIAQTITAFGENKPIMIDWVPVFQFFVYAAVNTPPNFLWQEFLEKTFPAHTKTATVPEKKGATPTKPRLNVANTLVKTLLDQTVGAAVNTFLFSMFMHGIKGAMARSPASGPVVDWAAVLARSRAEFLPILRAGWTFWPFVSLVNFALVKGVQARNLVGSLAGVCWGVYMSFFAAR